MVGLATLGQGAWCSGGRAWRFGAGACVCCSSGCLEGATDDEPFKVKILIEKAFARAPPMDTSPKNRGFKRHGAQLMLTFFWESMDNFFKKIFRLWQMAWKAGLAVLLGRGCPFFVGSSQSQRTKRKGW